MIAAWTRRDLLRHLAILAVGAVIGACGAVAMLGAETDRLVLENARLMDHIELLADQIALMEELGPGAEPYVETVEVAVTGVEERLRPAVEQVLRERLTHLKGVAISRVHAASIHQTLSGTVEFDGIGFSIDVEVIYVAPNLYARVRAEEHDHDSPG